MEEESGRVNNEVVLRLRLSRGLVVAVTLVAALALGLVATTGVFAQPDETINGCVSAKKGNLRIVEDPTTCTSKETAISWNQQGPKGDPGQQGPPGPDGGDAGTLDGLDSTALLPSAIYEVVLQSTTGFNVPEGKQDSAACDSGDQLLSGGFGGMDEGTHLVASFPEKVANLWVVRWKNDTTDDTISVHALCADFPPAHTS